MIDRTYSAYLKGEPDDVEEMNVGTRRKYRRETNDWNNVELELLDE